MNGGQQMLVDLTAIAMVCVTIIACFHARNPRAPK